jgi:2-keto-4-pentenoate hydratase/2-oxohepta-3-ene-1,7-dioic acid hydratase in catechol pathway
MKLIRFGAPGREKPGLQLADGTRVDASAFGEDWGEAFLERDGLRRLAAWQRDAAAKAPRIAASERLGPCITRPSKIVCIGLNYADHARETNAKIPEQPVIFFKATTALAGPNDDLPLPRGSVKTDWEVELAVVIGRRARYVPLEDAAGYVAGYALHNDYSEREDQIERGGQWSKGKSQDGFAPLGPFLATPDELGDVKALPMWLKVNGESRQKSSTREMIFDVPFLVSYLSRFMTLLPGDVISTGTPAGVGLGMSPPTFLKAGDVVDLGIDGLGEQRQRIVASAWDEAKA